MHVASLHQCILIRKQVPLNWWMARRIVPYKTDSAGLHDAEPRAVTNVE